MTWASPAKDGLAETWPALPNGLLSVYLFMAFFILFLFMTRTVFVWGKSHLRLPAGPRPLPIIGNVHQMLNQRPVDVIQKWHQKYGTMVTLRYGQQLAISIASLDIAHDLMRKRGSIYNSRPRFIIASERMTNGLNSAIIPYGKRWQNHHRIMNSLLDVGAVNRYRGLQDLESKQVLMELLATSEFESSISRYASSIIMTLGYGIRLERTDNEIPAKTLKINALPLDAMGNSYYRAVELFPILDRLPGFLAPWKRLSVRVEQETTEFHMQNLETAKSASTWNWVQDALQSKAGSQISSKELAYVIGTLQQAGFEGTRTVLRLLIKAVVLHPNCLQEAQRELDRVVGPNRLPSFDDFPKLHYIHAMMNEAMRWQPPTPFAIPHATTQDDEYMGYHIPNGTVIIPNMWAMSFNPEIFPNPYEFKPDRWIENPKLEHSPFGFGRRICPGRHLGWNSIFILMARLMWAYDITHAYRDGKRVDIDPWDIEFSFTASSRPFEASFQVRSPEKQDIIESEWNVVCKDTVQILEDIRLKKAK
ncbi:Cytochrome P450 [Penicillium camemberti]|uniref:Cytochrome P450 n=1 Tax=Penicillium camemberti (strain FM 013) TaxID=1429867 RepID=A0A0G4P797_PENC3|nr:Cytochrome P450 [Penicillium camemberti]